MHIIAATITVMCQAEVGRASGFQVVCNNIFNITEQDIMNEGARCVSCGKWHRIVIEENLDEPTTTTNQA